MTISVGSGLSEVEPVGDRQCHGVNLLTTSHHTLLRTREGTCLLSQSHSVLQAAGNFHPSGLPLGVSGNNNIGSARQRPANTVIGLAAHQDRLAHSHRLKVLEVFRQMPGQLIISTNNTIAADCHYQGDFH